MIRYQEADYSYYKDKGLSQEEFNLLNPISDKYSRWVIETYLRNRNKPEEAEHTVYKFVSEQKAGSGENVTPKLFDRLLKFKKWNEANVIPPDFKDIGRFKDWISFVEFISDYSEEFDTKLRNKIADKQIKVLFRDKESILLMPKSYDASLKYGANAKWCTASKTYPGHYDDYMSQGDLYIRRFFENGVFSTTTAYQLYIPDKDRAEKLNTVELMDIYNRSTDLNDIRKTLLKGVPDDLAESIEEKLEESVKMEIYEELRETWYFTGDEEDETEDGLPFLNIIQDFDYSKYERNPNNNDGWDEPVETNTIGGAEFQFIVITPESAIPHEIETEFFRVGIHLDTACGIIMKYADPDVDADKGRDKATEAYPGADTEGDIENYDVRRSSLKFLDKALSGDIISFIITNSNNGIPRDELMYALNIEKYFQKDFFSTHHRDYNRPAPPPIDEEEAGGWYLYYRSEEWNPHNQGSTLGHVHRPDGAPWMADPKQQKLDYGF